MFQGVIRHSVLSDRTVHVRYYLPKVEINICNVMTDSRKISVHPFKNDIITCKNIQKVVISLRDNYAVCYSLDYSYLFKKLLINSCRFE